MTLAYEASELRRSLEASRQAMKSYARLVNRVAEGEMVTPREHQVWQVQVRMIDELLEELVQGIAGRRVERLESEGGMSDAHIVPERLRTAYGMLCDSVYGSLRGWNVDDTTERVKSNRGWVTKSTATRERSGARAPKKYGSGRAVIKDERAMVFKRRIDKKIRRLAMEIEQFYEKETEVRRDGGINEGTVKACGGCGKVGEDDWKHCPRCGNTMKWRD